MSSICAFPPLGSGLTRKGCDLTKAQHDENDAECPRIVVPKRSNQRGILDPGHC